MEELGTKLNQSLAGDVRDPYPLFAEMRRTQPIVCSKQWGRAFYTVFRHADCDRVLRDAETFSNRIVADTMGPAMGRTILEMDGPEHLRHRGLISVAFRPQAIARWGETLVEPAVQRLLDDFARDGSADLVPRLTMRLPILVIGAMVGVRIEDTEQFMHWADAVIGYPVDNAAGIAASRELSEYLRPVIHDRRSSPRDDLTSVLTAAEVEGERLGDEDILSFLRLLLPAGAETTFRLLGNTLFALLTHPDQLEQVRADRSLIDGAVDEVVRWDAPLLLTSRETTRDIELCGTSIPAGHGVVACLGSANRDESHYPEPDRYDIHRARKESLSFGAGRHFCLGVHLARLELRCALTAIFDRLGDIELVPGSDAHIHGLAFRSPTALPVRFTPEA